MKKVMIAKRQLFTCMEKLEDCTMFTADELIGFFERTLKTGEMVTYDEDDEVWYTDKGTELYLDRDSEWVKNNFEYVEIVEG